MENKFEYGEQVYLAVTVNDVGPGGGYDYNVVWKDHVDRAACMTSVGEEQLFTAQEIADQCSKDPIDWQATYNEYSEKAQRTIAGLSKRITELDETIKACTESENIVRTNFTAKCDEIMVLKSENERLSKQNEELGTKVDNLEVELNGARSVNEFAVKTEQTREKLIEEQRGLIRKYGMVIDILLDKITALKKGENNG